MARKIKYTLEKEFIKVWFEGAVQAYSIADLITEIVGQRDKLPSDLKVLIDARRATFAGKPDDLIMILKKFREHYDKFELIKMTIILQNPYETAISIILKEMLRDISNVLFKVFSTEQAALFWLK